MSGERGAAVAFARDRYPLASVVEVGKDTLVESGGLQQLRVFRRLRGEALILFFEDVARMSERQLKLMSGLFHRCRLTIFADSEGRSESFQHADLLMRTPSFLCSALGDVLTISIIAVALRLAFLRAHPPRPRPSSDSTAGPDVAYLYPFPLYTPRPGGRLSFLRGSLSGLSSVGATCEIVSGCPLPIDVYPVTLVPNRRRLYLFKETQALAYNVRFVLTTWRLFRRARPRLLYQRHARFVVAGALLSRLLRVPMVLEYQTSEYWWAKTWGPARFLPLVRLAEDFSIRSAARLAVVSDVLREELVDRGVESGRIIVNPAAVDADRFRPGIGGDEVRRELGLETSDVVVSFAGSFSFFHGIPVLSHAIQLLLRRSDPEATARLRFLLIGDGPLRGEIERDLEEHAGSGRVVLLGSVSPERIPRLLDAADILVAPTVPMPDGKKFFGSPSKLFEYMAMSKAIVASDLEQLGAVLRDGDTALLVPPGDGDALAASIERLAVDADLRRRLGERARAVAVERHSWRQNADRLLASAELGLARPRRDREPTP